MRVIVKVNVQILIAKKNVFVLYPVLLFFQACAFDSVSICTKLKSHDSQSVKIPCYIEIRKIKASSVIISFHCLVLRWSRQFWLVNTFFALSCRCLSSPTILKIVLNKKYRPNLWWDRDKIPSSLVHYANYKFQLFLMKVETVCSTQQI